MAFDYINATRENVLRTFHEAGAGRDAMIAALTIPFASGSLLHTVSIHEAVRTVDAFLAAQARAPEAP